MHATLHINDWSTGQRKVSGGRSVDSGGRPDHSRPSVSRTLQWEAIFLKYVLLTRLLHLLKYFGL